MRIAIIAANGKTGINLVNEALKQGHDVTAFVRNKEYKNDAIKVVYKDSFELTKDDLAGLLVRLEYGRLILLPYIAKIPNI